MSRGASLTIAVLALAAAACGGGGQSLAEIAPKEEVELARECLGDLRAGRLERVERRLDPALLSTDTRSKLAEAAAQFPPGEPRSVELIGVNQGTDEGSRSANLLFQYEFEQGWAAAGVLLRREDGGPPRVTGVHVKRLPESLERTHAFTLRGRRAVHWLFLAGALLVPAFVIATLIACWRASGQKKSWGWIVLILLGVGGATLNWTTGRIALSPLEIQTFGAAVKKASPHAPWLVTLTVPLGALLYLVSRRLRGRSPAGDADATGSDSRPPPA
jgi:hypothetical protein